MGVDPSAASRTFSGDRRMKIEEATQIATFLNVPVAEVFKHAGVDASKIGLQLEITGFINESGVIEGLKESIPMPQAILKKAQIMIGVGETKVAAIQVRATAGPLSIWDDAVMLYSLTDAVEQEAVGVLSICRNSNGDRFLAKIDRARRTGESVVISPAGKREEMTLVSATPVLAVIT
jgi:hypothetical protein